MGQVSVEVPSSEAAGPIAQPRYNQLLIGLGYQKRNSKMLLTLIVAKHLLLNGSLFFIILLTQKE